MPLISSLDSAALIHARRLYGAWHGLASQLRRHVHHQDTSRRLYLLPIILMTHRSPVSSSRCWMLRMAQDRRVITNTSPSRM